MARRESTTAEPAVTHLVYASLCVTPCLRGGGLEVRRLHGPSTPTLRGTICSTGSACRLRQRKRIDSLIPALFAAPEIMAWGQVGVELFQSRRSANSSCEIAVVRGTSWLHDALDALVEFSIRDNSKTVPCTLLRGSCSLQRERVRVSLLQAKFFCSDKQLLYTSLAEIAAFVK